VIRESTFPSRIARSRALRDPANDRKHRLFVLVGLKIQKMKTTRPMTGQMHRAKKQVHHPQNPKAERDGKIHDENAIDNGIDSAAWNLTKRRLSIRKEGTSKLTPIIAVNINMDHPSASISNLSSKNAANMGELLCL
jgi:hypothetical protein